MKRELTDLRKQIENDRIKLKENKSRILDEARREAKILVMDAKDEANSIIRDLEKMRQQGVSNGGNLDKKTSAMRDKLKKKEDTIDKAMARAAKPKKTYVEPPKNLKPGATVKIVDMNQEATVLKEPDKNGNVRVQAGIIKMDVHITNLRKVEEKKSKELAEKYVRSTRTFESKSKNVSERFDVSVFFHISLQTFTQNARTFTVNNTNRRNSRKVAIVKEFFNIHPCFFKILSSDINFR